LELERRRIADRIGPYRSRSPAEKGRAVDEDEQLEEPKDEELEEPKVAIDAAALHLLRPQDAIRVFDAELGSGTAWSSPLMQYRTTAGFQEDWKIEVGNWIERARRLGYVAELRRNIVPHQQAAGDRSAGDAVHRNVTQQLAQAQLVHYFVGTGWGFQAWEPSVPENRSNGTRADVDVQLIAPNGPVVDFQVKASGQIDLDDRIVDEHIQKGIRKAAAQMPTPAVRPALIAVLAQRGWPLTANVDVVEQFIGSSAGYPDGTVLLHDNDRGEFMSWPHISGIVLLDHRRGLELSDYGCVLIQNPSAAHPVDPAWFPHARVLTSTNGVFTWLRGRPAATTFPPGARFFQGTIEDAMRSHGERRAR
jgi:hypothetical protein